MWPISTTELDMFNIRVGTHWLWDIKHHALHQPKVAMSSRQWWKIWFMAPRIKKNPSELNGLALPNAFGKRVRVMGKFMKIFSSTNVPLIHAAQITAHLI